MGLEKTFEVRGQHKIVTISFLLPEKRIVNGSRCCFRDSSLNSRSWFTNKIRRTIYLYDPIVVVNNFNPKKIRIPVKMIYIYNITWSIF